MNRYNNNGMSSHSGSFNGGYNRSMRNDEPLSKTNVFIRGLGANTTDQDLINLCEKYGTIVSYKAITDRLTNECKGYGFVNFENPNDANKAVRELSDIGYQARMSKENMGRSNGDRSFNMRHQQGGGNGYGRRMDGSPRYSNGGGGGGSRLLSKTNVYLRGLDVNTSDDDLHQLCTRYGNILSAKAIIDRKTNECKGYGFVNFETEFSAEQAVNDLSSRGYQVSMSRENRFQGDMPRPILADGPPIMDWQ